MPADLLTLLFKKKLMINFLIQYCSLFTLEWLKYGYRIHFKKSNTNFQQIRIAKVQNVKNNAWSFTARRVAKGHLTKVYSIKGVWTLKFP